MLILILKFFIMSAYSSTSMLLLGGGGEPENKEGTIFDEALSDVSDYAQKNKVTTYSLFDGGHSKTESIIASKLPSSSLKKNISNSNLDEIIKNIMSGKLPLNSNDQLMIYIDSHGSRPYNSESLHTIAGAGSTSNLVTLEGAEQIDLKKLQTIVDYSNEKHFKLAIIDASCFSGASLNFKNSKNTCIITSTDKSMFSFASNPYQNTENKKYNQQKTFNQVFTSELKSQKFKNLEDLFLYSREKSVGIDFPNINSDTGLSLSKILLGDIEKYFSFSALNANTMDSTLKNLNNDTKICEYDKKLNFIMKNLDQLMKLNEKNIPGLIPDVNDLKNKIRKYHELIKSNAVSLNFINSYGSKKIEGKSIPAEFQNFTYGQLFFPLDNRLKSLKQSMDEEMAQLKKRSDGAHFVEQTKKDYELEMSKFQKLANFRDEFSKTNPEFKKALNGYLNWNADDDKNFEVGLDIATSSRKIYNKLYQQATGKDENSCRGFKI
jgi:hypothetical protein